MSAFSNLNHFINTNNCENDGTSLIKVNTMKGPSKFYNAIDFAEEYSKYISHNIESGLIDTHPDNNLQVCNAMSVIYLDGDWTHGDETDMDIGSIMALAKTACSLYCDTWVTELKSKGIKELYRFEFIPKTYDFGKSGFHGLIFTDKIISKDDRDRLYENVKRNPVVNELYTENFKDRNYEEIFDKGPLKSMQALLPFAQKKGGRRYILNNYNYNGYCSGDIFIIPHIHTASTELTTNDSMQIDLSAVGIDTSIGEDADMSIKKQTMLELNLGKSCYRVIKFIESFRYFTYAHPIWDAINDNSTRLHISRIIMSFLNANYFLEHNGFIPEENAIPTALTDALFPMLIRNNAVIKNATTPDRSVRLAEMIRWYTQYTSFNDIFTSEIGEIWRKRDNVEGDEEVLLHRLRSRLIQAFDEWVKFICDYIMTRFTREISPFNEISPLDPSDPRNNVTFINEIDSSYDKQGFPIESFYRTIMTKWCEMFMFCSFYNSRGFNECVRSVITTFVRYYIYEARDSEGKTSLFIYNTRQIKSLASYPYNQWLETPTGKHIRDWISYIYTDYIKPSLDTVSFNKSIGGLISNYRSIDLKSSTTYINFKALVPWNNFGREIENLYSNVMSSLSQKWRKEQIRELDAVSSPYFPCRNGMLEFNPVTGDHIFHTDNFHHYIRAYTNVIYDPDYKYDETYREVEEMWRRVYPDPEEYDYMMSMYASTLHGIGLKDQFIIQYGTGSDGKSITNFFVQVMLGMGCGQNTLIVNEDGRDVELASPSDICLASSMKAETVLMHSNGSHDSGGLIQLKNRRLCVLQEPDLAQNNGMINCSTIKDMQSGSVLVAREIYQPSSSFSANGLIIFQTNQVPSFSEATLAIRRRLAVILMRSKFSSAIIRGDMDTLKHTFVADPNLTEKIKNDYRYRQALFYLLLPYAKKCIKNRYIPLSNIPRPESIRRATESAFARANGIIGYLYANVIRKEGRFMSVPTLIENIKQANSLAARGSAILQPGSAYQQMSELTIQIAGNYMGKIYRLKPEFYEENYGKICLTSEGRSIDTGITYRNDESIIDKYFEHHSVSSLESTQLSDTSYNDLYIVGFTTNDN